VHCIGKSAKSMENYRGYFKYFLDFIKMKNCLSTETVKEFHVKMLAERTRSVCAVMNPCVRGFLSFLYRERIISFNLAVNMEYVQYQRERSRVITEEQGHAILDHCKKNLEKLVIRLFIQSGLRLFELTKLKKSDFVRAGDCWKIKIIGKGNKLAFVSISGFDLLNDALSVENGNNGVVPRNADEYLFASNKSKSGHLNVKTIHFLVKRVMTRAGFEMTSHHLRVLSINLLLHKQKMDLASVMKHSRHSQLKTLVENYVIPVENPLVLDF